jgi:hypothetical protein
MELPGSGVSFRPMRDQKVDVSATAPCRCAGFNCSRKEYRPHHGPRDRLEKRRVRERPDGCDRSSWTLICESQTGADGVFVCDSVRIVASASGFLPAATGTSVTAGLATISEIRLQPLTPPVQHVTVTGQAKALLQPQSCAQVCSLNPTPRRSNYTRPHLPTYVSRSKGTSAPNRADAFAPTSPARPTLRAVGTRPAGAKLIAAHNASVEQQLSSGGIRLIAPGITRM